MNILKLLKIKNLLIIAIILSVFHFGFLKMQDGLLLALSNLQFLLLLLSVLFIAAAATVIIAVFNQENDAITNPKSQFIGTKMSEKKAYNLYIILNIIGVGLGFMVSNSIEKPNLSAVFIVIAFLLYMYASSFKNNVLARHFLFSFLLAFCILIVGIFDLYPTITPENRPFLGILFHIMIDYAVFVFLISFLIELTKDLRNFSNDKKTGINTLPNLFGLQKTQKMVFVLAFLPLLLVLYYLLSNLKNLEYVLYYVLVFVIAPLLLFIVKTWQSKTEKDYQFLVYLLQFILISGVFSIYVITYNLHING